MMITVVKQLTFNFFWIFHLCVAFQLALVHIYFPDILNDFSSPSHNVTEGSSEFEMKL